MNDQFFAWQAWVTKDYNLMGDIGYSERERSMLTRSGIGSQGPITLEQNIEIARLRAELAETQSVLRAYSSDIARLRADNESLRAGWSEWKTAGQSEEIARLRAELAETKSVLARLQEILCRVR